MSLASDVAAVLQDAKIKRVNFRIGSAAINKSQVEKVVDAINNGSIEIALGDSGPNFGASYTSWKTRRTKPGEQKKIGQITISPDALDTKSGKVSIFHESVHALVDVADYKLEMRKDEAFAYLADALYMAILGFTVSTKGKVGALYIAANAIITTKKLLKKQGTAVKWSECKALIAAIKKIPAYS